MTKIDDQMSLYTFPYFINHVLLKGKSIPSDTMNKWLKVKKTETTPRT